MVNILVSQDGLCTIADAAPRFPGASCVGLIASPPVSHEEALRVIHLIRYDIAVGANYRKRITSGAWMQNIDGVMRKIVDTD